MQAVQIKKNEDGSAEITKRGEYPRFDMEPVEGLEPNFEWLLIHKEFNEPDYDPRIYVLEKDETITSEPHPQYPHLNQLAITFRLEKRPLEAMKTSVVDAENLANQSIIPPDKMLKKIMFVLGGILRSAKGITLTEEEKAFAADLLDINQKMWKNHANAKAKITALTAGQEPDLDESWESAQ